MKNEKQTRRLPKLLICLMLSLVLVVSSSAFFLPAEAASFGGGSGTKSNPYIINTAAQLKNIGSTYSSDKYFKLGKDIDLSGYASGKGWVPIGSASGDYYRFYGTLDGNGKVIKNLVINRPTEKYAGLFDKASGATFKNLGVTIQSGKSVLGGNVVGGLVADANNSTFTNCYVKGGTVESTDKFVDSSGKSGTPVAGGLVGSSYLSTFTNCFANTNVVANASKKDEDGYAIIGFAGGLIADTLNCKITGCYSAGTVKSTYCAGGLVGEDSSFCTISKSYSTSEISSYSSANRGLIGGGLVCISSGTIQNCYATGSVTGKGQTDGSVGGLIGYHYSVGLVKNCYAAGAVTKQKGYAGGFAGYSFSYTYSSLQLSTEGPEKNDGMAVIKSTEPPSYQLNAVAAANDINIENCYFDTTTTKQSFAVLDNYNLAGVSGKTTAEMRKMGTFSGWNFSSIWSIDEDKDYPRFALTKIALNKSSVNLAVKATETLYAIFTPAGAANQTVKWSSNNTGVATVSSSGKVTAQKVGTATITANAGSQKATCTVTVKQDSTYVTLRVGYSRAIQNGVKTTIDSQGTKALKIKGKTMLPLRFVGEKMGGKVSYTNDKSPIYMSYGNKKVEFKLGSSEMKVTTGSSTKKVTLDVPAQKRNGRTMIPLRAISQALGFDVYYQAGTELIIVSNPKPTNTERDKRLKEGKAYITK